MTKIFALCLMSAAFTALSAAQLGIYQHGSVVRMHMGDCILAHHGFAATFGGPAAATPQEFCPEYTLVSNDVVFLIVGKSSSQLIPLAETIDFRIQKNQLAVRVDDARHESKFTIKEMTVRAEWERLKRHMEEQLEKTSEDHGAMSARD
jgi:hypothetical protein